VLGNSPKNSKYDLKKWLDQIYLWLKSEGRTEYAHSDLPEWLKNKSYHHSVTKMGMLEYTGKIKMQGTVHQKIWKLKLRYVRAWQIEKVHELAKLGKTPAAISKHVSLSINTIRKEVQQV